MKKLYEEPVFDVTIVFFEDLLKESGDPEGSLVEGGGSGGEGAFGSGEQ